MKKIATSNILALTLLALAVIKVNAQDADPALVEQARQLSDARSEATFVRQCTVEPARFPGLGDGVAAAPVKLFDNLYYVGRTDVGAWVIETSDGLALIDTLYTPEDAANIIVPGMRQLGLDPDDLKVVFVTHFHGDHSGGAPYFQERGVKVMLSQADWASMPAGAAPDAASIASDGQVITLGDTPITVVLTPGHTPGAISLIFPVFDQGMRHTAAVMELSPRGGVDVHREAVEGIEHLGEFFARENVDIALHPHEMIFDPVARDFIMGGAQGDNPLVIGTEAVQRFGRMVDLCWQARIVTLEAVQ
ncbi:MAG: MBL fold metallo-hydrolase [Pseudomonadales bacterium]|jgi:metallo-beta-lactamase class B|nr:MBL fold metallo-hydrolase [Pseudomonadales bacterium]